MKNTIYLFLLIAFCQRLDAAVWLVGPTRTYTMPSQVSGIVNNGDTVYIDAGIYNSDVTRWMANDLYIKGVGGFAHLKANGNSYGGKAIWVIQGNNTTVDSIEFSLCSCPSLNGAGIRQEGHNLTVRNCYFHDNENGILCGVDTLSDIVIEYSEFEHNGYGDGYSHNLYIGHVRSLTFQYNYTHRTYIGHELKSRASANYILYNRIANEDSGDASREIDLPNGGLAVIIGNEIQQGPMGTNSNLVGYGLEGLSNAGPHELYCVNNTFVNEKGTGTFLDVKAGTAKTKFYNNIFAGPGSLKLDTTSVIDSASNVYGPVSAMAFGNASTYDYSLQNTSPAINIGSAPGTAPNFPLTPDHEYVHPANVIARPLQNPLDAGAHENAFVVFVSEEAVPHVQVYPNPAQHSVTVRCSIGAGSPEVLQLWDVSGRKLTECTLSEGQAEIDLRAFPPGMYLLKSVSEKAPLLGRIVKN